MITCTSCGHDVTGKKFCPECGTPVQQVAPTVAAPEMTTCPRCNGTIKAGTAFCMHCGSSLSASAVVATAQSQPLTRQCIACHSEVPVSSAFCTNCGQTMQSAATPAPVAAAPAFCTNCGMQNAPGVRFCGGCGSPLTAGTPAPQTMYPQQSGVYGQPAQYGQPQYPTQYPQQSQQYPQQAPQYPQQQYGQMGYQPQPMVGQQPMVLRCPVCMAMSPLGTANCPSCRTSLAGIVPTPAAAPMQGQQGGGLGGFLQGPGGGMAVGALGGAAAVIGGEMLLNGLERRHEYGGRREGDGMLGDLGNLANDVGLF